MPISLLGAEWEPKLPPSFVQRQELLLSYMQGVEPQHQLRVWAAAIGLTWNHPDRTKTPSATLAECAYDPRLYGEQVANELIAHKVRVAEIILQGSIAYAAIAKSIIPQSEVDERAGFSSAAGAPSHAADEVQKA